VIRNNIQFKLEKTRKEEEMRDEPSHPGEEHSRHGFCP
jgi:hypothetical protein